MKFYNPFKINAERLTKVEARLTKNSQIIEEDHGELVDLKTVVAELRSHVERLHAGVEGLRSRQNALRLALSKAISKDD